MVETLTKDTGQENQKPEATAPVFTRSYEPEEFEADTTEERLISLLAKRRQQFLAGLKARQEQFSVFSGYGRIR